MAYKSTKAKELREGDIFTDEIKLKGREQFLFECVINDKVIGRSMIHQGNTLIVNKEDSIYFLRNIFE